MVPYVRKSFYKHYKDFDLLCRIQNPENVSIDDRTVYKDDKAYSYAKRLTVREVYQAVEGMYHNLNTLQSRSGNQLD